MEVANERPTPDANGDYGFGSATAMIGYSKDPTVVPCFAFLANREPCRQPIVAFFWLIGSPIRGPGELFLKF